MIALEAVDSAIFRADEKGGKAEVRIATGGGKSHLIRIIEREYVGKAGGKIDKVLVIEPNSPESRLDILQTPYTGQKDLAKTLIPFDEAYFFGEKLNPTADDLQEIEK